MTEQKEQIYENHKSLGSNNYWVKGKVIGKLEKTLSWMKIIHNLLNLLDSVKEVLDGNYSIAY